MTTQIAGSLKTWNQDKGFGFITPTNGGQDIFVHISDYPRVGGPPKVGDQLLFEVALNKDGKKKAVKVQRPGHANKQSQMRTSRDSRQNKPSAIRRIFSVLLFLALVGAGYGFLAPKLNPPPRKATALSSSPVAVTGNAYRCDGRRDCSQMTSCEEAKYFLKHCPDTKMDGDHDGIPCESQWCTSPFAK